jgi:predicted nucleotidyltransferase component of viral defense system
LGHARQPLRNVLDPWLGQPRWKQNEGRVIFSYRFDSEDTPPLRLRLKVEINSREHFAVFGIARVRFEVDSRWFKGSAEIGTYTLDELLGTKLRALYQRRKGRDLFDLATALESTKADAARVVEAFSEYMRRGGHHVTRAAFEQNLEAKLSDPQFNADISPLLAQGYEWDAKKSAGIVRSRLISRLR